MIGKLCHFITIVHVQNNKRLGHDTFSLAKQTKTTVEAVCSFVKSNLKVKEHLKTYNQIKSLLLSSYWLQERLYPMNMDQNDLSS